MEEPVQTDALLDLTLTNKERLTGEVKIEGCSDRETTAWTSREQTLSSSGICLEESHGINPWNRESSKTANGPLCMNKDLLAELKYIKGKRELGQSIAYKNTRDTVCADFGGAYLTRFEEKTRTRKKNLGITYGLFLKNKIYLQKEVFPGSHPKLFSCKVYPEVSKVAVDERIKQLHEAHRDFGPTSQHFLTSYELLLPAYVSTRLLNPHTEICASTWRYLTGDTSVSDLYLGHSPEKRDVVLNSFKLGEKSSTHFSLLLCECSDYYAKQSLGKLFLAQAVFKRASPAN
ncbi:hypothetical protein DUI87_15735 [Hirundo rustica rustica]|uniref:Uncharacterized protein n=1 Tax=Hirundo rustica rustica TaxID=333673 RepID=A0A3M0K4U2_HIRRU|nr:hypothetical protein DUI87_15735 [Hirundo rustica rustica]